MRVQQENYIEQEQIGTLKEYSSTISEKNLSLVLDNVTKNLYSDPIGAFVRELTSNAVDANKRNFKSEKVKVRIYEEGDSIYFEVKDEGKGMSPDTFENVYMSWFESDKRNDNGQIGGWGIGSKSPLAYTEHYEVITVHNGIQYDYEIVRQAPAPRATLISEKETNKKSGTTVRVELDPDDSLKLHHATVRQLVYFDDVIVTNELWYYDNHFKLIDHSDFIVRSDKKYPFKNEMHIVIGQVAYPIDWNVLGITAVQVPVGIKFPIGSIPVNLNRETIHYATDEVKHIIIKKVAEMKELLKKLYIERLNITNLKDYLLAIESPKTTINLGGYEVYFGIQLKDSNYSFKYKGEIFSFEKEEGNSALLRAFQILDLSKKEGKNREYHSLKYTLSFADDFTYSTSRELEHWSSLYHKRRSVIRRLPLTYTLVKHYADLLGLTMEVVSNSRFKTRLKTGAVRKVYNFIKAIEATFEEEMRRYEDVPQAFIDDEKAKQEALKEERKGNITYYDENGKKEVVTLKSLIEDYQYVFYISRDASKEEQFAYMQLYRSFDSKYNRDTIRKNKPTIKSRILVAIFSPSVINKIKNKTKDLTISKRVVLDGKKQWVTTTKKVYAFLSADRMFDFTELYSQFHKLRYTTLLNAKGISSLGNISPYYSSLRRKIPLTDNFFIKYDRQDYKDVYLFPYYVFRERIDAIVKNRNYEAETAFNILIEKADVLALLNNAIDSNSVYSQIRVHELIKKYKITKLKQIYYGY